MNPAETNQRGKNDHRVQVLALYLGGKTETEIEEETGIAQQTVNRWLEEFQNMDTQKAQMSVLGIHHLVTTPPEQLSEEDRAKAVSFFASTAARPREPRSGIGHV